MKDSEDVGPPPPTALEEPSPSHSEKQQAGVYALRCFLTSVVLTMVCAVFLALSFAFTMALNPVAIGGFWLIGELILTFVGIKLGLRGIQSWQGKCGLCGSILMGALLVFVFKRLAAINAS